MDNATFSEVEKKKLPHNDATTRNQNRDFRPSLFWEFKGSPLSSSSR